MRGKYLIIVFVAMLTLITGCGKSASKEGTVNKKITLESMKNEDTSYLDINGKVMSLPFKVKDFFNVFTDFDAFTWDDENNKDKKIDLNEKLPYMTTVQVSVIKKSGDEDDETKLKRTRLRFTARILPEGGDTVGNALVTGVSYQYVDNYSFGTVKINGIEINKTTAGEVMKFFEETYGKYVISDNRKIKVDRDLLAKKFKKIEYWGVEAYPVIYANVDSYLNDQEPITFVSVNYDTNTFIYKKS